MSSNGLTLVGTCYVYIDFGRSVILMGYHVGVTWTTCMSRGLRFDQSLDCRG